MGRTRPRIKKYLFYNFVNFLGIVEKVFIKIESNEIGYIGKIFQFSGN